MQRPLVPVGVNLFAEGDDVALVKVQLALLVRVEGVDGLAAGLLQRQLAVT